MNQLLILLTDDDDDDRLFMRQAIERHIKQAIVCEAQNGSAAVKQLVERVNQPSFNLVLLDINMPLMNGFEVLDQIRSSPALKYTPTVMLSTSDHPDQVMLAYRKGVNAYIKKPATFAGYDDLAKAIEICFLRIVSE